MSGVVSERSGVLQYRRPDLLSPVRRAARRPSRPSREGRRPSPPSWEGRGKPSVLSIEFAWQVLKDLMTWYYHGKDIPIAKLPVRAILAEWYEVCNEDGISVRPQRAAPKGNSSCGSSSSSSVPLPLLT